jgi:hypothetical protein
MTQESNTLKLVRMAATRIAMVLFRNNVAQGWVGKSVRLKPGQTYTARGGERIVFDPRALHAGLIVGSGDGIGWDSIVITPEMVGCRVAVIVSAETKSKDGRLSDEQKNWRDRILADGGIAVVCKSESEFVEAITRVRTDPSKFFPK